MKRAWFELLLVIAIGLGHLVFDGLFEFKGYYVAASIVILATYVAVRLRTPGQASRWGLSRENWRPSSLASGVLLLAGSSAIVGYGLAHGRGTPPATLFYLVLLYPVWGVAQQLVLCPLLYGNLVELSLGRTFAAAVSAVLFGLVHAPDWTLCVLTMGSALAWVGTYDRWPNLWCQGISHGILGALAYHYVFGRDPWTELMSTLTR